MEVINELHACRYGNICKEPHSKELVAVRMQVQDQTKRTAETVVLEPSQVHIPIADGDVQFGPVVLQRAVAMAGKYSLRLSADRARPIRVKFDLVDAQGISAAEVAALNDAKAHVDQVTTTVKLNQSCPQ